MSNTAEDQGEDQGEGPVEGSLADSQTALAVTDITDTYRTWTIEYMEEHSQMMEEFDHLCNVT